MLATRQLRGHHRHRKTIVEEITYRFDYHQIAAATHVGVQPEMIGQYVFGQRARGQFGPGEVRLTNVFYDPAAGVYVMDGTHTRLA
jgi:hypothetical protein